MGRTGSVDKKVDRQRGQGLKKGKDQRKRRNWRKEGRRERRGMMDGGGRRWTEVGRLDG